MTEEEYIEMENKEKRVISYSILFPILSQCWKLASIECFVYSIERHISYGLTFNRFNIIMQYFRIYNRNPCSVLRHCQAASMSDKSPAAFLLGGPLDHIMVENREIRSFQSVTQYDLSCHSQTMEKHRA